MLRETYDAVLRECAARSGDGGSACAADKLLAAVGEKVDFASEAAKAQLSAIGQELTRPLREVLAVDAKTPRAEKLNLFKVQVVSRLLVCCDGGAFDAAGQEDERARGQNKTGVAKAKGKKKAKKKAEKKMSVGAEVRELLDRVALLIDSANPPSIADSEDEPSPFHVFLISVLERRLNMIVPDVFKTLREVYELTEDEQPVLAPLPIVSSASKEEEKPTTDDLAADSTSILSALKDKRPSKKRSLASTSDAFKEMILPGQPSKAKKTKHSASVERAHTERASSHARRSSASTTDSNKRPAALGTSPSLMSLAAASKKSKPTRPSSSLLPKSMPMSMPMLVRNVDRQMLPTRGPGMTASGAVPVNSSTLGGQRRQPSTARPTGPGPSHLSVVMRTPDRPQRVQRSQPRILVEASPPLRNPFATARLRRPGPQLPK